MEEISDTHHKKNQIMKIIIEGNIPTQSWRKRMPGPVEATSSMLDVANEDSVCHKIMRMNIQVVNDKI